jgi:hypothetical protein
MIVATNTTTSFCKEDFDRVIELMREISEITPKEYTLRATDGKYDTIFVPDWELLGILKKEFGNKLNVIVNTYVPKGEILLYDSRTAPVRIKHED